MTNPATEQKKGMRNGYLYECNGPDGVPLDCGFQVRDASFPELARLVRLHVKDSHSAEVDEAYIRGASKAARF